MTNADTLATLDALPAPPTRRTVDTAAAALVPSIIDAELSQRRQELAKRFAEERARIAEAQDRATQRAWWRAWEQQRQHPVLRFRESA